MTTITISRQMGSLGHDVARRTAECLGYRLLWREVINQAARRAGAPETALAEIDELGLLDLRPSPYAVRKYHAAVRQVMHEAAAEGGAVIVGRAGQSVLHGVPGVLHVRVIAPAALRAERVAAQHGISLEAACARVEASDRHRRSYLRRYYHVRWDDPEQYDLTLNTEHLSVEVAADLICRAALQHAHPHSP